MGTSKLILPTTLGLAVKPCGKQYTVGTITVRSCHGSKKTVLWMRRGQMESTPDNCTLNPGKPADKLTAVQLADILGTSSRAIAKMATNGKIPFETINGRGDRRFYVSDLLASDTLPEKYKAALLLWHQQQMRDESPALDNSIENPENLPVLSNGNQTARVEDILQLPVCREQNHPWQSLPEACRDEGLRLYKIVEGARKVKAGTKKGKGRSGTLGRYAKKEGVELKTLYRWIKKADRAVNIAKNAGESDLVTHKSKCWPQITAEHSTAFVLGLWKP